jgi:DNA-binding NarL/FixJ family response regulator
MKLLIVEDSPHIRASLVGLMECLPGIDSICTADSLAQAMTSVRLCLPTMVILDLQLPDGLGIELIEPMKHLAPTVHIAVLTNHANAFNKRHCMAIGADWFFDKSTEFDDLIEVVRAEAELH